MGKVEIEKNLMSLKGWAALGAFNSEERSHALDLLGFNGQLIFATPPMTQFLGVYQQQEQNPDLLYGGAQALNRAIGDFCRNDRRMMGIGFLPLNDPARAQLEIEEGLKIGCGAFWIPAVTASGRAPSHPDFDRVWSALQDYNVPFMLRRRADW